MKIIKKLISLALMIIAPIISWRAFYEYVNITYLDKKPSYPFGKELMNLIHVSQIDYLSTYAKELLTIGVVFLMVSVIAYISMMIKALINLVWLALMLGVGYYVYQFMGK